MLVMPGTITRFRSHGTLAKNHGKFLTSLAKILPRSCHDLGKDAMTMQDRAKANHDLGKDAKNNHVLGKDAKINHVLGKRSMVANAFFFSKIRHSIFKYLPKSTFRSKICSSSFWISRSGFREFCTQSLA